MLNIIPVLCVVHSYCYLFTNQFWLLFSFYIVCFHMVLISKMFSCQDAQFLSIVRNLMRTICYCFPLGFISKLSRVYSENSTLYSA